MWDPVPTAGSSGAVPVQRAKVLPTASSRMCEAGLGAQALDVGARAEIGLREDDAGDRGRGGIGDGGERLQFLNDLAFANVERHLVTSGWRFQSL